MSVILLWVMACLLRGTTGLQQLYACLQHLLDPGSEQKSKEPKEQHTNAIPE